MSRGAPNKFTGAPAARHQLSVLHLPQRLADAAHNIRHHAPVSPVLAFDLDKALGDLAGRAGAVLADGAKQELAQLTPENSTTRGTRGVSLTGPS